MTLTAQNSQGNFSLTGSELFSNVTLTSGMGFSVDASLTLVSDPGSLIELGPVGTNTGGLPNIGVFAGSTVPEPTSVVELAWACSCRPARGVGGGIDPENDCTSSSFHAHAVSAALLVAVFLVCLFPLAAIPASAGTITVDNIDQPISVSSTGFEHDLDLLRVRPSSKRRLTATIQSRSLGGRPVGNLHPGLSGTRLERVGFCRRCVHRALDHEPCHPTSTQNTSVECYSMVY